MNDAYCIGTAGRYYNQWRYDGADVDSKEYKMAFEGFKKFFDEGIFTKDTLDLDYASATEEFTNGNALVYYMGSWESPLLSKQLREKNGIELEDVGAMHCRLWRRMEQHLSDLILILELEL